MSSIRAFRTVALLEAASFLALLVATAVKYAEDAPGGVEVLGPLHGVLFLAYVGLALAVREEAGWSARQTLGVLLGAVLPFGGFVVNRWQARREAAADRTGDPAGGRG